MDEKLWEKAWRLLEQAQKDSKHAFATPVIATVSPSGTPRSRTVILRKADKHNKQLWCYTDRRSIKAQHIAAGNEVLSWTFWAPDQQLQFNCEGKTTWLPEEEAQEIFSTLPKHSRKAYATLAPPGSAQAEASDGLPKDWSARSLDETDETKAFFGVLVTHLIRAEVLQLDRQGHQRLIAQRTSREDWRFGWLVP